MGVGERRGNCENETMETMESIKAHKFMFSAIVFKGTWMKMNCEQGLPGCIGVPHRGKKGYDKNVRHTVECKCTCLSDASLKAKKKKKKM